MLSVHHLEDAQQVLVRIRTLEGLRGEADVVAHVFVRPALHPGDLHAKRAPLGVQAPDQRGEPGDAALGEDDFEAREPLEDALGEQAD